MGDSAQNDHAIDDLATRLSAARAQLKMSRRELARRANVDHCWVRQLESGERCNPSAKTVKALAEVLGISLDWLMGMPGTKGDVM